MTANGDWWKYTATAACGVCITFGTLWVSGLHDFVRRTEVVDMIARDSPWIAERGELRAALATNAKQIEELRLEVRTLIRSQAELTTEIRVLTQKLTP